MTFQELFDSLPELVRAYNEVADAMSQWLGPDAMRVDPAGEVDCHSVVILLLWLRIRSLERQRPKADGNIHWEAVTGLSGREGDDDRVMFINNSGETAELPAEFLQAFMEGKTIAADIESVPNDPSMLCLSRADHADGHFPRSLLRHLMVLRREGKRLTDDGSGESKSA